MFDKALRRFEDLIRRSIAPSVTFFVVAMAIDLLGARLLGKGASARFNDCYRNLFVGIARAQNPGTILTFALLFLIGISYALASVQQVLFDNRLKVNFDPLLLRLLWKKRESALKTLRRAVQQRIEAVQLHVGLQPLVESKVDLTDYILYEVLGGIDPTPVRSFVDWAKAMGVFHVAVILVLVGNGLLNPAFYRWWCEVLCALLVLLTYWLGYNVTAAQYRARALRLYVNFLAMPVARINCLLFPMDRAPAPRRQAVS